MGKFALYVGMFFVSMVLGALLNTYSLIGPAIGAFCLGFIISLVWGEKSIYWPFIVTNLVGFALASVGYNFIIGFSGGIDTLVRFMVVCAVFAVGFFVAVFGSMLTEPATRKSEHII